MVYCHSHLRFNPLVLLANSTLLYSFRMMIQIFRPSFSLGISLISRPIVLSIRPFHLAHHSEFPSYIIISSNSSTLRQSVFRLLVLPIRPNLSAYRSTRCSPNCSSPFLSNRPMFCVSLVQFRLNPLNPKIPIKRTTEITYIRKRILLCFHSENSSIYSLLYDVLRSAVFYSFSFILLSLFFSLCLH